MSLPRSFLPLVKSTRFWSDYLFLTDTADPPPYKAAFQHAYDNDDDDDGDDDDSSENEESEDEESEDEDSDQESESKSKASEGSGDDEKVNPENPEGDKSKLSQSAATETVTDDPEAEAEADDAKAASDEDEDDDKSSSSSASSRPYSPYLSHHLIFHFRRTINPDDDSQNNEQEDSGEDSDEEEDPSFHTHLSLSLTPNLSYFELSFSAPSIDMYDISIAHDDQAHWHPFVLRWEELEVICRAVSITAQTHARVDVTERKNQGTEEEKDDGGEKETSWKHPGLPLLFLYRFAPICDGDNLERITAMLARAFQSVLGDEISDRDIRRFIERMDCRERKFRWFKDDDKNWWIGRGDDPETAGGVYTYRSRESVRNGKWRNDQWNHLIAEAKGIVDAAAGGGNVELEGELSEEDRELAARFAPRKRYSLEIWLALREKDRPLHQRAGRYLQLALDGVLRILDLGRATSSGASSCIINGRSVWTSDHSSISIHGDLPRGRAIIKQMLWWLRAPLATTLRNGSDFDELPFNLADASEDVTNETYLAICVPDILPDCSWLVGHTLPDSLQTVLESKDILGDSGKLSERTSDGWVTVTTADGGEVSFNFCRFDNEPAEGTGALALRKCTPQTSYILHRLMLTSGAVLMPVALAAKPLEGKVADMSWVRHRVVDAQSLHWVLSEGAYEHWVRADRGRVNEDDEDDVDGEEEEEEEKEEEA